MKETIYKCDYCKEVLSSSECKKDHFSLNFGHSGWAHNFMSEYGGSTWKIINDIKGVFQFCNSDCVKSYLDDFVKKV